MKIKSIQREGRLNYEQGQKEFTTIFNDIIFNLEKQIDETHIAGEAFDVVNNF